jgi:neutral ceramidase
MLLRCVVVVLFELLFVLLKGLQARFGSIYNETNVLLHGTHTHSGPGGFAVHPLYDVTTLGYHKQNVEAIVNGIVEAISQAHNNLSNGGRILINQGELINANSNRGAYSYLQNPLTERLNYKYDTDKVLFFLFVLF